MRPSRSLSVGVLLVALAAQTRCALKVAPPPLPSEQVRAEMGAVGVVGAAHGPDTDFSRPVQSKPLAALVGMGGGLAVGVGSGTICFVTAGYAGPFCALAIWTPGMMATGIAEGIDKGVTMKEVKAGTGALRDALTDAEVQQMLRDAVLRAALERAPATSVVAVLEGRPRGPEEPTSYAHLAAEGLDTVLEVGVLRLELRRANDPGPARTYGPSLSFESWMNPRLELKLQVRVRLFRVSDGALLFSRLYENRSHGGTFGDWTRDGARAFREARDTALERLGAEIAGDFFRPAPNPAGEPSEPAQLLPPPPDSQPCAGPQGAPPALRSC